mgnify:CR=1 FL=1
MRERRVLREGGAAGLCGRGGRCERGLVIVLLRVVVLMEVVGNIGVERYGVIVRGRWGGGGGRRRGDVFLINLALEV